MNKKTKTFVGLAAAFGILLAGTTAAFAAPGAGKAERTEARQGKKAHGQRGKNKGARFAKADKNNDGFLTEAEVGAKRWKRISVADANKDRKVSKAELQQAHKDGKIGHRGKKGPRGGKGKQKKS
ncbi:MAG: hypothetical protein KC776_18370 [Myxococcales bacterium]|nr:hypothetical protein [Myxococcales bacterium]